MSEARKLARPAPMQMKVTELPAAQVSDHCIGVTASFVPDDVLRLATESGFHHVVQTAGFQYQAEVKAAEALVATPENFLHYPVSSILRPDNISAASEASLMVAQPVFNCSSQKRDVIAVVVDAITAMGYSQTLIDDVSAVADEFFTNAVYNAPFVDLKTFVNPGVSRNDIEVRFEAGKSARLILAQDESRLVIGCQDPYGSLDLGRYLNGIKATYLRGAAATMNFGTGGAGIGSYIIFNAGSSLYFGVWPGKATLLCCVIPLGMSYRKRVLLPKHLHWIKG